MATQTSHMLRDQVVSNVQSLLDAGVCQFACISMDSGVEWHITIPIIPAQEEPASA